MNETNETRETPTLTPQDEAALAWIRNSGEFTLENAIATDRFAGVKRLRPTAEPDPAPR